MDNKLKPTVYGIGVIGYGRYNSSSMAYRWWRNMLMRVTDENYQNSHADYTECNVCNEWLNLQNFGKWFEDNYIPDFQLDKDLIEYGNKTYSPHRCLFVPRVINKFFHIQYDKTNDLPYGVAYNREKFRSIKPNRTFNSIIDAKNCFWNNKYNKMIQIINDHNEFEEILISYFEIFFGENYE